MAAEDIRIFSNNGRDISFYGELIARATSDRDTTPLGDRWFDLRVYRIADGGFVPVIEFHSTVDGEDNVTIAERVDQAHDIENFFYVFEPSEVTPERLLKVMKVEERQRHTKSILRLYDTQVNRVLLATKEHASDDSEENEPPKAEKKGLLDFFRRE